MKKLILMIALVFMMATPVNAMDITAPEVPQDGQQFLKEEPDSFGAGLWSIIKEGIALVQPAIASTAGICVGLVGIVILVTMAKMIPGASETTVELIGTIAVAAALIQPTGALIQSGAQTVSQISDYGKLLIPVLTAALAAQGGMTSSTALYAGTIVFDTVLSALIKSVIVPVLYIFLCLCVASTAMGEQLLGKLKAFSKWLMTWGLKIILYVFTGFIGITGVVTGSVDAAALKATKLTISGMVPVVGGILSDASETILVSAGVLKNAAGVYGMLAVIALWIGPFIKIGVQYLLLKGTFALCSVFSAKQTTSLIQDFSSAMGMLLAMTGTMCALLLLSVICFMKGVAL